MTEQPDTAAIRVFWNDGDEEEEEFAVNDINTLCDALDAARAERDEQILQAEANLAEQERVTRLLEGALKSAEARIAAALAILHDCHVTAEDMKRVRRALTGDTP